MTTHAPQRNWAGNYEYRAATMHHPTSHDELRELIAHAPQVRALGSRHSFTSIGDAGELVALDRLGDEITIDHTAHTVAVPAATTYAELATELNREGLALANLASLPHISVAGAIATATHGSGEALGNLATSVMGLELVTSTGELLAVDRHDERFPGIVVSLGALGVLTRVTLTTEPYYEVAQRVYEDLEWDALFDHLDQIEAAGDSVSVFHQFGGRAEQLWVKQRVRSDSADEAPTELFGARAARAPRHPVPGADPVNCTAQLGEPGPWSERLPHFRSGFTPSSGEEIQSEAFVARADAIAAIQTVRELAGEIRPLLLVSELRAIAADELWLSPHSGRDTLALHFTWRRDPPAVQHMVGRIEAALAPFDVRPHWGKVTSLCAADLAPRYEHLEDFCRLRAELDPRGAFVNDWLREHVLGDHGDGA